MKKDIRTLFVLIVLLVVAFSSLSAPVAHAVPPLGINMDDGTVSAPAFSFSNDADTGIYRIGANNLGISANGAKVLDVSTSGLDVTGALSIGSVSFSGVTKFGTQSVISTTNTITHGFSAAPTACVVSTSNGITATVASIVTTTMDVRTSASFGTLYWFCGK